MKKQIDIYATGTMHTHIRIVRIAAQNQKITHRLFLSAGVEYERT